MRVAIMLLYLFSLIQCRGQENDQFTTSRNLMVQDQLINRGINDKQTLNAFYKVPRHKFVPIEYINQAYDDHPLPIGFEQTISQPFVVAYMTEVVKPLKGKKGLEIGTGSGYQAAILAEIIDSVYTIEIVPELALRSADLLKNLKYQNVKVKQGDGYKGWPQYAPFDIIIVTAACSHIPQPLIDQLADDGRLVIPVGDTNSVQVLTLIEKKNGKIEKKLLTYVRFVPFTREKKNNIKR